MPSNSWPGAKRHVWQDSVNRHFPTLLGHLPRIRVPCHDSSSRVCGDTSLSCSSRFRSLGYSLLWSPVPGEFPSSSVRQSLHRESCFRCPISYFCSC